MGLHTCIHLFVGQIDAVMDKRLPYLIQSRIVQVLRLERRLVDHAVTRVTLTDAMLLNELHGVHLLSGNGSSFTRFPLLPISSCALLAKRSCVPLEGTSCRGAGTCSIRASIRPLLSPAFQREEVDGSLLIARRPGSTRTRCWTHSTAWCMEQPGSRPWLMDAVPAGAAPQAGLVQDNTRTPPRPLPGLGFASGRLR